MRSLAGFKLGLLAQVTASVEFKNTCWSDMNTNNTHTHATTPSFSLHSWIQSIVRRALTVGRAPQDLEAQAGLGVVLQREDADVLGGHGRAEELGVGRVPVLGPWEELDGTGAASPLATARAHGLKRGPPEDRSPEPTSPSAV